MLTANQLEKLFDNFFRSAGYVRVDAIIGASPNFENCDYVCIADKILFELKIIEKDYFEQGGIIHRLNTIVTVPVSVDKNGLGMHEFSLPETNREGINDSIEEPLRRLLKKANKQLKATNSRLFSGSGTGFIIIVLKGIRIQRPDLVFQLTLILLEREFSGISGCIVCYADENSQCLGCFSGSKRSISEAAQQICWNTGESISKSIDLQTGLR